MKNLAVIPARSGSKGLPGKNIRELAGKPLIAHTILPALEADFDRVIFTTDSEDFAAVARQYGAEVPFIRPAELAADNVLAKPVLMHALDWLEENDNYVPDNVVYMQPTSPFRTPEWINKGLGLMVDGFDSVVAMKPVREHPYVMVTLDDAGHPQEYVQMENKPERRQTWPPVYICNPFFSMSRVSYLRQTPPNALVVNLNNFNPLIIGEREANDVDALDDFLFAEFLLSKETS